MLKLNKTALVVTLAIGTLGAFPYVSPVAIAAERAVGTVQVTLEVPYDPSNPNHDHSQKCWVHYQREGVVVIEPCRTEEDFIDAKETQ